MHGCSRFTLDLADITEGTPLSEASTRPRAAQTQKRGTRHGPAPKTEKRVSVKGNGQAAGAKSVRGRSTAERHNTTEADHEHQEDHSEQTNLQPFREGDPGFEAAYQASLGSRRQRRSNFRGPPRPANLGRPSRHIPETPPTRLSPQDDVSDSELLGYSEERTLRTATEGSNPPPDPRVPAPPRNLANSPTPSLRRPRTSPMTGLPFEPLNRRPEALSGYSDTTVRRRGSSMSSRVPPSTRTQLSGDNDERTGPTMNPNPSLPTDPANLLSQDYYYRSPGGSYYHDVSPEIPTSATNPWPSSSSGMGVTQNRSNHGRTQPIGQPSQPSGHTQPVGTSSLFGKMHYVTNTNTSRQATQYQNPVNDATDRDDAQPNSLVRRLSEEIRRHENASLAETLRHDHALRRIAMDGGRSDDIAGFLERDNESERREKQGSTDEDNE